MHSWRILLLPFLDGDAIYKRYHFDEPWDGPNNRQLAEQMPSIYALHGCEKPGNVTTNYLRVVGDATASPPNRTLNAGDVKDGTANTLFIVENVDSGVHWMEPRDLAFDSMSFTVSAPNGISSWLEPPAGVTLAGMVERIQADAPPNAVKALLTIAGEEDDAWKYLQEIADGRQRPKARNSPCGYSRFEPTHP